MEVELFDFATWQLKARLQAGAFQEMDEMVTNPQVRSIFLDSAYPIDLHKKKPAGAITGAELLRCAKESGLLSAHDVYLRQMVVVIGSMIETLCLGYFKLLFKQHPNRMAEYIHSDSASECRAMVHLKEVIRQSKEELIESLAGRAAKRVIDLHYSNRFSKMAELAKAQMDEPLLARVLELFDLRNKVVHENYTEEVGQAKLYEYFKCIEDLAKWCAYRLEANGVTVRWEHTS